MKLVARLNAENATTIVCDSCDWRGDDDDPCDGLVANGLVPCPKCGSGRVEYEFEPGEVCGGCKTLALHHPIEDNHGRYCSRPCMLQAEWARALEGGYG